MSYSALEAAIRQTANALQQSWFGLELQRLHPGRRAQDPETAGSFPTLAALELSLAPPVYRTLHVLETLAWTGKAGELGVSERQYVDWIGEVHRFLTALVGDFWAAIRPDIRTTFFDEDDVPAFASRYIPDLRVPHPPTRRATTAPLRLTSNELARIAAVSDACRNTEVYRNALDSAKHLRANRRVARALAAKRETLKAETRAPLGPTLGDDTRRIRGVLEREAAHASDIEAALRAYNELVHTCMGCLLAWIERDVELVPVDPGSYPMAVFHDGRTLRLRATSLGDYWMIKVGSPFEIRLGGPLDGIYQCQGFALQGLGSGGIADLWGRRVQDLEQALP